MPRASYPAARQPDDRPPIHLGFAIVKHEQTYRLRAPASGREAIASVKEGQVYVDRETGEEMEPVGRPLPLGGWRVCPGAHPGQPAHLQPLRPAHRNRRQRLPVLRQAPGRRRPLFLRRIAALGNAGPGRAGNRCGAGHSGSPRAATTSGGRPKRPSPPPRHRSRKRLPPARSPSPHRSRRRSPNPSPSRSSRWTTAACQPARPGESPNRGEPGGDSGGSGGVGPSQPGPAEPDSPDNDVSPSLEPPRVSSSSTATSTPQPAGKRFRGTLPPPPPR